MLFLELAAQAVRGFSPSVRAALKPGYQALQAPSDLPAPLSGLILSLAWPDGRGGDAAFLAPGSKAGRAGLSIQGNDGSVWRIVRDLGGAGGLHKLNRATNQFEVVTQDSAEMAQALRASAGFPARTTWEQLFTLTGPQLSTRRPKQAARAQGTGAPGKSGEKPALKMAQNQWADLDAASGPPPDLGARLQDLQNELRLAKEAAEIQFTFDGVNSEIYSLETKLKVRDELVEKVAAARKQLESVPTPASLGAPDDILERVRRHPDDRKRMEQALAKIADERAALLGANEVVQVPPLVQNQHFLIAMAATVLLLVGPALFLEGQSRALAMLSIVSGAFAAVLALRHIEDLQHAARAGSKGDVFAAREKRITDEFQLTSTVVTTAMNKLGVADTEDFLAAFAAAEQLQPALAQLEAELAQVESDPATTQAAARMLTLRAEAETLNEKLVGMSSGYLREPREIEREIAKLQESLAPAPPPKSSASGEFSQVPTGATESWEDPTPALLVLATDLFTTDVPSLWSVLHDRAVQYVSALTDRRYHGIEVDKDGHATLQAPGRAVPAKELPGKDADLYFLALRLTLIEKAAGQSKLPVVIEDTFNTVLDQAKAPLFGRMVKHLGSLTQVLHVTGAGASPSVAEPPSAI